MTISLPYTSKLSQNTTSLSKPEKRVYNRKTNHPVQQGTLKFHDNNFH